jgi:transcription elongation factor GreA
VGVNRCPPWGEAGSVVVMETGHHLTPAAHQRLSAELEDLVGRGRIEVADRISRAREMGDLSENGDYHAAREDQGLMEARVRQLEALLKDAVIVEASGADHVVAGSIVTLLYEGDDDDMAERYLIGSIEERVEGVTVISVGSPLGRALMDHKVGDTVPYEAPNGELRVVIRDIT